MLQFIRTNVLRAYSEKFISQSFADIMQIMENEDFQRLPLPKDYDIWARDIKDDSILKMYSEKQHLFRNLSIYKPVSAAGNQDANRTASQQMPQGLLSIANPFKKIQFLDHQASSPAFLQEKEKYEHFESSKLEIRWTDKLQILYHNFQGIIEILKQNQVSQQNKLNFKNLKKLELMQRSSNLANVKIQFLLDHFDNKDEYAADDIFENNHDRQDGQNSESDYDCDDLDEEDSSIHNDLIQKL